MMKLITALRVASCVLFASTLQGCAFSYSAKPIHASVIDAETNAPLPGVIVVAHWVVNFGWEGGGTDLMLMETVTDAQGRFSFPAWGPVAVPSKLPIETRMKQQSPEIILVRDAYELEVLYNDIPISQQGSGGLAVRTSDWDGKTIALKPFRRSLESYGIMVSGATTGITYPGCTFRHIPKLLGHLMRVEKALRAAGTPSYSLPTLAQLEVTYGKDCGSIAQFLEANQ